MRLTLPWLDRDNPAYDPNRIGAITQMKVAAALVEAGMYVLYPTSVRPYDLAIEDEGRFYRVQCKTGRLIRGTVYFRPHRLRAAKCETGWKRRVTDYRGQIDFFGIYSPDNGQVYLVPIGDVESQRVCTLRLSPAKNNQRKRVRWAKDYVLTPLQEVQKPADKIVEVRELFQGP